MFRLPFSGNGIHMSVTFTLKPQINTEIGNQTPLTSNLTRARALEQAIKAQ